MHTGQPGALPKNETETEASPGHTVQFVTAPGQEFLQSILVNGADCKA